MLKVRSHYCQNWWNKDLVYSMGNSKVPFNHFGDTWVTTNYLLRISQETKKEVKYHPYDKIFVNKFNQIRKFLSSSGKIKFVEDPPQKFFYFCDLYAIKFIPTIVTWEENANSNIIAYQFDGVSNPAKNLPVHKINFFLNYVKKMGFNPVDVGHYRPVNDMINILSKCRFFVGCPSGVACAARSVGCPIFFITHNLDKKNVRIAKTCEFPGVQTYKRVENFLHKLSFGLNNLDDLRTNIIQ